MLCQPHLPPTRCWVSAKVCGTSGAKVNRDALISVLEHTTTPSGPSPKNACRFTEALSPNRGCVVRCWLFAEDAHYSTRSRRGVNPLSDLGAHILEKILSARA